MNEGVLGKAARCRRRPCFSAACLPSRALRSRSRPGNGVGKTALRRRARRRVHWNSVPSERVVQRSLSSLPDSASRRGFPGATRARERERERDEAGERCEASGGSGMTNSDAITGGYDPGSNSMPSPPPMTGRGGGWPRSKLGLTSEFDLGTRTRAATGDLGFTRAGSPTDELALRSIPHSAFILSAWRTFSRFPRPKASRMINVFGNLTSSMLLGADFLASSVKRRPNFNFLQFYRFSNRI